MPPAKELGLSNVVLSWSDNFPAQSHAARAQGYQVYLEVPFDQAAAAAKAATSGLTGIILTLHPNDRADLEKFLPALRSTHPKLRFLVLEAEGKQPQMRGGMVVKRGSVLEVSSPTAQPWIDTNLALVKVLQRLRVGQVPLYTFSWPAPADPAQDRPILTADDYSLAVAEAGAYGADLVLELDDRLQKGLSQHDPQAWALWKQVRLYANFYSNRPQRASEAAADVGIVADDLDPSDEVMNLLARHNIPFKVLRPADLQFEDLHGFDVLVVFAKPDQATSQRIIDLATQGKTVVIVDAHGAYPWQNDHPIRINEHTTSYSVGKGTVLELSEAVTDPETFAQDIRRLVGTHGALLSLWNGLTTIAVPYAEHGGTVNVLELINYAEDPLRLQVQVKGSFSSVRFESPEHPCCQSLVATKHNGFTEFVIPDLRISGRVHLAP
ncbi:MAG TPA: hypothetical protein VH350_10055 [Candidatus Sulfotelmatobacter sp.]|nr:hypothetical protein [Candidatus Sulfotelmatobacter sp.]